MNISDGEKLIIFMLRDIYKENKVDGEIDPDFVTSAISSGDLWSLKWRYQGIFDAETRSQTIVDETCDILDMWQHIELSCKKLNPKEKKRVEKEADPFGVDVRFSGFDANNEDHYGVAARLISDLERYEHFKRHALNSHHPSIETYRRMLPIYGNILKNIIHNWRSLNADEIIEILKEITHPKNR